MKTSKVYRWGGCLAGLGLGLAVMAQEGDTLRTQDRDGQVVGVRSQLQERLQDAAPEGMDREQLSQLVRERLQSFEKLREQYQQMQRDVLTEMRGASEEQREALREQIRANREEWVQEMRKVREQVQERLQQLKDQLPSHQELLEAARERIRERVRDQVQSAQERVRRGTD